MFCLIEYQQLHLKKNTNIFLAYRLLIQDKDINNRNSFKINSGMLSKSLISIFRICFNT